jgi:hypothetical protein
LKEFYENFKPPSNSDFGYNNSVSKFYEFFGTGQKKERLKNSLDIRSG